ncbi:MAG: sensor histidine kinase [Syntrophaceae bacterium]|nr:sensor histidine kinase [Syntrophaceae bacterium]
MKGFKFKKDHPEKEKLMSQGKGNEKESLFDLLIHDLTSPLSIVATTADNLLHKSERYGPLTDQQKRMVDRISRNIHKAQKLLQEMIEILRSEEGIFQKDFFSIEETLRESLLDALEITHPHAAEKFCQSKSQEEFQNLLHTHHISIEMTGRYCQSPFCHDQKKVQQILRNLLSNALKYRREKMGVMISGETDLLVSVEDDGIGIPAEEQDAIFKRFVRLNDKKAPHIQGLGLGLTGIKTLIKAMGGEIVLQSQEGVGTRFIVRIPPIRP